VEEVRGRGLLLGAVTATPAGDLVTAAREQGLLVLTAGDDVLRLAPPLTVTAGEVESALATLDRIFR
jgi:acetylornithine/succinyldiaminopimelate/putrescine aminotransferase